MKSKLCPALNWSPGVPDERLKSDFDALENPPDGRTIHKTEQGYTSASCIRGVLVDQHFLLKNPKAQIEKTSPQAKRHKSSLHVISLHFFSLLCLF